MEKFRLIAGGAIGMGIIAFACLWCYGAGRASIVDQCVEHRAFVYGDGAWGCNRLRKTHNEVDSDMLVRLNRESES